MNKSDFDELLAQGLMLGDGALGTELARRGQPAGVCPELWAVSHPEVLQQLGQEYIAAGARFITTPTFGGAPLKLARYGLEDRCAELNAQCVHITRAAALGSCLVAANIGPTGELLVPMDSATHEELIAMYRQQVTGLLQGNPDFFLLETFMDIAEARAAVIAIKELCNLPFVVSMTFEHGRTLTGATPEAAAVVFTALGASAVGCNCSGGPESLVEVVKAMARHTTLPIFAKPNAGLPQVINGTAAYPMNPEEFAAAASMLADAGAAIIGGCCGTTPQHIAALSKSLKNRKPVPHPGADALYLSSQRRVAAVYTNGPLCIIGEKINPSGKAALIAELQKGCADTALRLAQVQMNAGVQLFDINAGAGGVDEPAALSMLVEELSMATPLPLSIDSANPDAMEKALRLYAGRALLNSINLSTHADRLFHFARLYGAAPVLMPLDGWSLPPTAQGRRGIIDKLLDMAHSYGFDRHSLLIDCGTPCAAMCVSAAKEAVEFTRQMHDEGYKTVAGISNVSYGLPERSVLNAAYLAELVSAGLSAAILNPVKAMMGMAAACSVLRGDDAYCEKYINLMRNL